MPQQFWVIDLQYTVPQEVLRAQGVQGDGQGQEMDPAGPRARSKVPKRTEGEGACGAVLLWDVCRPSRVL